VIEVKFQRLLDLKKQIEAKESGNDVNTTVSQRDWKEFKTDTMD